MLVAWICHLSMYECFYRIKKKVVHIREMCTWGGHLAEPSLGNARPLSECLSLRPGCMLTIAAWLAPWRQQGRGSCAPHIPVGDRDGVPSSCIGIAQPWLVQPLGEWISAREISMSSSPLFKYNKWERRRERENKLNSLKQKPPKEGWLWVREALRTPCEVCASERRARPFQGSPTSLQ